MGKLNAKRMSIQKIALITHKITWVRHHPLLCHYVFVDVATLKMARKSVKIQRKVQQNALGKVNRVKEIRRRGKEESVTSRKCEVKGGFCEVSLGRRGRSSYEEGGRGMIYATSAVPPAEELSFPGQ